MRILVVEDDKHKIDTINALLGRFKGINTTYTSSVHSAVNIVNTYEFDLIILDMALPSHDPVKGGAPAVSLLSGGIEIVLELSFLKKSDKVVVLTQYPEVEVDGELLPLDTVVDAFSKMGDAKIVAALQYVHCDKKWERALENIIMENLDGNSTT